MRQRRFMKEQVITILQEHQAGLSAAELCEKHGISETTFCKWRSKFGRMEVSDSERLRALEEENGRIKTLLAEMMMDISILRGMFENDSIAKKACRHDSTRPYDAELRGTLKELSYERWRCGRASTTQSI